MRVKDLLPPVSVGNIQVVIIHCHAGKQLSTAVPELRQQGKSVSAYLHARFNPNNAAYRLERIEHPRLLLPMYPQSFARGKCVSRELRCVCMRRSEQLREFFKMILDHIVLCFVAQR